MYVPHVNSLINLFLLRPVFLMCGTSNRGAVIYTKGGSVYIQWLKLDVNILNSEIIKIIRKYPDGDTLLVLWIGLLCLAMKSSRPGEIQIADGLPYTASDLSTAFDIPLKTVELGITVFMKYGMIQTTEGGLLEIVDFRQSQSIDKLEYKRELSKNRVAKFREKQRLLQENEDSDDDKHVTRYSNACNAQNRIEKNRKEKKRIEKNKEDVMQVTLMQLPDNLNNDCFVSKWREWIDYRKTIKKRLTAISIKKQIKFLSKYNTQQACQIIENSMKNDWQGLFDLNFKSNNKKSKLQSSYEAGLEMLNAGK